ncbi:NADH:ubiquinone oxidoreductase [Shinella sp. CPCC 100929]|uniref:NADH:ubiquinone oxidoreductase n=1 Tax=Shinella lacus TaxID=2654216 RepID=A0ABT1RB03_9HYPH|nr:NADH:ubiquinone oxidoreductase [Shinella lacus]MCQ4632371.1 NADH:ubiquinone oxidoreductase [Shinella lacus]
MTKPAGQDANATRVQPAPVAGDDPFGLAPWLKDMPGVPLHPLMAHPVAAMAATTAIGFGIAGQMAGLMLGMMKTATERARVALDEAADATAETVAPVKAKPVLNVVVAEPKIEMARESATPKKAEAKPARKAPAVKAAKADDLKAISGIGPKLEQVLNGMGVRRYADIAALKAEDVARIEAELGFAGRIARDRWVEQAKALVKGRG